VAIRDLWQDAETVRLIGFDAFALGVALALYVTSRVLARKSRTPPAKTNGQHRENRAVARIARQPKWVTVPGLFLVVWALMATGVYCGEHCMRAPTTRIEVHHVYQILTGNWSSSPYLEQPPGLTKPIQYPQFKFAASVSFAIVLNLTTFGLFTGILLAVAKLKRERSMILLQGVTAYEGVAKQSLYDLFPGDEEKADQIDRAFEQAKSELVPHLTAIFGREATERYLAALRQDVSRIPKPD
jgi:hypothetical protein